MELRIRVKLSIAEENVVQLEEEFVELYNFSDASFLALSRFQWKPMLHIYIHTNAGSKTQHYSDMRLDNSKY